MSEREPFIQRMEKRNVPELNPVCDEEGTTDGITELFKV